VAAAEPVFDSRLDFMSSNSLKLYVKTWCPWCVAAQEWLDARGYKYQLIDVEADPADYAEMIRLSGQRRTPTLVTGTGELLPDFGPDELEVFVRKHSIQP
jgi:glutaredoxin